MDTSKAFGQHSAYTFTLEKTLDEGYGEQIYFADDGHSWVSVSYNLMHYWEKCKLKGTINIEPSHITQISFADKYIDLGYARYPFKGKSLECYELENMTDSVLNAVYTDGITKEYSDQYILEHSAIDPLRERVLLGFSYKPPRDGSSMLSLNDKNSIKALVDRSSGKVLNIVHQDISSVRQLWQFSSEYLSGVSNNIGVWDKNGKLIKTIGYADHEIAALVWYDNNHLLVFLMNGQAKKIDISGDSETDLFTHDSFIRKASLIGYQGKKYLAAIHDDNTLRLWPLETGISSPLFSKSYDGTMDGVAGHPTKPLLYLSIASSSKSQIHILKLIEKR